ncbi:hypothetical protein WM41_0930 [Corynebacterium simulans]|uniref:Uncharacterized protein n=1 Tax=Corynebacterium simulans TaxID=146827 RepID=A0ABR5VBR2_9CORY|nr:hypothetical protein WM41_0930 [Corynebacterium simulans]
MSLRVAAVFAAVAALLLLVWMLARTIGARSWLPELVLRKLAPIERNA